MITENFLELKNYSSKLKGSAECFSRRVEKALPAMTLLSNCIEYQGKDSRSFQRPKTGHTQRRENGPISGLCRSEMKI